MKPQKHACETVFSRTNRTVQEPDSRVQVPTPSVKDSCARLEIPISTPARTTMPRPRVEMLL